MPPLISIITPTRNAGATLAETLESVVAQGEVFQQEEIEYLLIDALSSDETLQIAARYPHLQVISESDHGIYDGMNKGARAAKGEWLLFLQADDWLPEGTLEAYQNAIQEHPQAEIICGSAEAVRQDSGKWKIVWSVSDGVRKKLTVENIALGEPMINARLMRRETFLKLGGFSLEYSLASDRDFLLRAAEMNISQVEIPAMTYRYRWHSGSSTMTAGNSLTHRLSSENLAIAKKYLSMASGKSKISLQKWHTQLTVQAAMNALESLDWNGLFRAVWEGIQESPLWALHFITEIMCSLPGFVLRGGRTRSAILHEGNHEA